MIILHLCRGDPIHRFFFFVFRVIIYAHKQQLIHSAEKTAEIGIAIVNGSYVLTR